jgi:pimeloyl-ACP methyl ester carboxylesterase
VSQGGTGRRGRDRGDLRLVLGGRRAARGRVRGSPGAPAGDEGAAQAQAGQDRPIDRDGLEPPEDFFQRDADADRLAAHERNQARCPTSVETAQDFVDAYLADTALFWYDYTADTSSLWEGTEVNLEVLHRLFKPDTLGGFQIDALDVPVFLALGRYDYAFPFYLWDEPKKRFSNLRYKLYDKSAHQPPYEQPDEFTADVLDWANGL